MILRFIFLCFLAVLTSPFWAQEGSVKGKIIHNNQSIEFVQVSLKDSAFGVLTDSMGYYEMNGIPYGAYMIEISYVGYQSISKKFTLQPSEEILTLDFELKEEFHDLDEVVVTGTKTFKRKTDSPVIVNVTNSQTLNNVQTCSLSEGLKFQPGLRVETDCQTCNYTQLRINGLGGGYSQILINGRPIFSPLTGLYGLEQIPANMIDRIEVVKGGGSSLYGSSAIGGTVNVISKIPESNYAEISYSYQNINGQTHDNIINGNATLVSKNKNAGLSFFLNNRKRGLYDHNGDNFSEIPLIENTSLGSNFFLLPKKNQKLELNLSYVNEFRYGGEMNLERAAHLNQQAEERTHHVFMGSADYQINFQEHSSLISYVAMQYTERSHFTGIFPDDDGPELIAYTQNPPYGTSDVFTYNIGLQFNHKLFNFLNGENVLTAGAEFIYDDVEDVIPSYNYLIDQTTENLGFFAQSDWEIIPNLSLLSGLRVDQHNLIESLSLNPRFSLLYKHNLFTQFRLGYGSGFRAPQAFDADLHIAFAGGGISRVMLSPDLEPEKSQSYNASINYDKPTKNWVAGFTLEGFYNKLNSAFFLDPIGEDQFGEVFEKRNGSSAHVKGILIELRANYNKKFQIESGFTIQNSQFDDPIEYIDGVEGIKEFIRTPNNYGYAIFNYTPNNVLSANLNYVYTGSMILPHFAGAPEQQIDELVETSSFSELSARMSYNMYLPTIACKLEIFGGVKNIFNAYQSDFDSGKNRDSNYVYGPASPRTYFIGLKFIRP